MVRLDQSWGHLAKRIGGMWLWDLWVESRWGCGYVDVHIVAVLGYRSIYIWGSRVVSVPCHCECEFVLVR